MWVWDRKGVHAGLVPRRGGRGGHGRGGEKERLVQVNIIVKHKWTRVHKITNRCMYKHTITRNFFSLIASTFWNLKLWDCIWDHFWAHTVLLGGYRWQSFTCMNIYLFSPLRRVVLPIVWKENSEEFSCTIRSHLTSFNMSTVYLGALRGHPPESMLIGSSPS